MSKQNTVCFTGMEAAEHERLTALFAEANRRLGNAWSLAPENDADMLVIDVDSLYGHMSWLKVHNSGRTVVALSTSAKAEADHVLQRPVTLEALAALLAEHGNGAVAPVAVAPADTARADAAAKIETPTPPARRGTAEQNAALAATLPRRVSAEQRAVPAAARAPVTAPAAAVPPAAPAVSIEPVQAVPPVVADSPVPTAAAAPAPAAPAPAASALVASAPVVPAPVAPAPATPPAAAAPAAAAPAQPRLADYLQPGALPGPVTLHRGDAPALVLDPTARVYLGGSGLKDFLAYTREPIPPGAWTVVSASELTRLRQELGGTQPFSRLLWLAALSGSGGQLAPGLDADARYRLSKWPQIEREFPKHFRIATTMMKGFLSVAEIAQQSGASAEDVADFINASLATGHAESDRVPEGVDPAAAARGGLLGRLRGGR